MRTISAAEISDAVRALCIGSNRILPDDMRRGLAAAQKDELWPTAAGVLDDIIENYRRAERLEMPVCQDTGMACVFVELGQRSILTARWKKRFRREYAAAISTVI